LGNRFELRKHIRRGRNHRAMVKYQRPKVPALWANVSRIELEIHLTDKCEIRFQFLKQNPENVSREDRSENRLQK
jgi:hypothetical protein